MCWKRSAACIDLGSTDYNACGYLQGPSSPGNSDGGALTLPSAWLPGDAQVRIISSYRYSLSTKFVVDHLYWLFCPRVMELQDLT